MANKIILTFLAFTAAFACILHASAQNLERLPNHNLFPRGSASNPIYVQPAYTLPPIQPQVVAPPPLINVQPRVRENPVYAAPEKLAPRSEFESTRFIAVEPYVYNLSKGDMTMPKKGIPKNRSRVVIGKTRQLRTSDSSENDSNVREVHALMKKYHADEIIFRSGREWSDGQEILVKFIQWK